MATHPEPDYILGTDPDELARLRTQHETWLPQLRSLVEQVSLADATVLDIGCGPGFTTIELARQVGPGGGVIACDASREFLDHLTREADRLGLGNVEPLRCKLEDLSLPAESIDVAYGRWVLSWIDDVESVLRNVRHALRPGGALLLQEYVDWGRFRVIPRDPAVERAVAACMASWRTSPGEIDVAERLPEIAKRTGFELRTFELIARSGRPGDSVWQWIEDFFEVYLPRLVRGGLLTRAEREAWTEHWGRLSRDPESIAIAPVVANVVLVAR
ncbi:MAG: methyltransferase domain-containing protein [Planctomycetes bacterium]|nr:methyltransferase domain-containing protein [Planctomycetota bacterium]